MFKADHQGWGGRDGLGQWGLQLQIHPVRQVQEKVHAASQEDCGVLADVEQSW